MGAKRAKINRVKYFPVWSNNSCGDFWHATLTESIFKIGSVLSLLSISIPFKHINRVKCLTRYGLDRIENRFTFIHFLLICLFFFSCILIISIFFSFRKFTSYSNKNALFKKFTCIYHNVHNNVFILKIDFLSSDVLKQHIRKLVINLCNIQSSWQVS